MNVSNTSSLMDCELTRLMGCNWIILMACAGMGHRSVLLYSLPEE